MNRFWQAIERKSKTGLIRAALVLVCLGAFGIEGSPVLAQDKNPVQAEFEALDAKQDHAGMVGLWKRFPGQALYIIDSYLEKSLALWEKSETRDAKVIQELHERALRGARAADEALGTRIFVDYCHSFVGWDEAQKKSFRGGQKAYREARGALKAKDYAQALEKGRSCLNLAQPLGDWWGTAMGYSAMAAAQEQLGQLEAALMSHSQSRLIYAQFRLGGAEYRNVRAMAGLCWQLGRVPRARASSEQAANLGQSLGDAAGVKVILEQWLEGEKKHGSEASVGLVQERLKQLTPQSKPSDSK